ncbi:MAG: hypothetical protein AAB624_02950 [Patescibacteria group bacterium]
MADNEKLSTFGLQEEPIRYVETMTVKDGVECDVYSFNDNGSKDLGVVRVNKGAKTPLQRVLAGVTTTEGFLSGKGTLTVQSMDGEVTAFTFDEQNHGDVVVVEVGQIMQWEADADSELVFYEVCVPPYIDGRFENLPE